MVGGWWWQVSKMMVSMVEIVATVVKDGWSWTYMMVGGEWVAMMEVVGDCGGSGQRWWLVTVEVVVDDC